METSKTDRSSEKDMNLRLSDSPKLSLFSRSTDNLRPRFPRTTNINLFERPFSALSRHRIHELSDIREVSGSSKGGTVRKHKPTLTTVGPSEPKLTLPQSGLNKTSDSLSSEYTTPSANPPAAAATPPRGLGSRAPSALSLPLTDVPLRRSSASFLGGHSATGSRGVSVSDFPSWKLPGPAQAGHSVPSRGRSDSPVRAAIQKDAIASELLRHSASRTFIKTSPPLDVVENGNLRHPRVEMTVKLPSPLFVGGGTIEGQVALNVDANTSTKSKLKPIHISKLSVDIIGLEEVSDGRRWIFLSLATELFDHKHPPPSSLVSSQDSISTTEQLWPLKSGSSAAVPFCINLPLNIGPPPYFSKQAGIRYLFCPTATIKIGSKQRLIRQTWNIQMLTVHDPQKALASLPDPLLASDSVSMTHNGQVETCRLTAGLHRQAWVNGAALFVDIHITNNTSKSVKKIEVQIEKSTLWYSHAAAGTVESSASHLRLPKKTDKEYAATAITKKSREWDGVPPHASEVRTCNIDVPLGHVTISTGRYFEVRYFLNVIITVGMFKTVTIQMPILLIHMNSLDILPNSLAQVAAAIELKRARTVPVNGNAPLYSPYHQGQAFTAPRRQSLDRLRNGTTSMGDDISALTYDLENSPRKYGQNSFLHHSSRKTATSIANPFDNLENMVPRRPSVSASSHHHHVRHPSCYHCQLLGAELGRKSSSATVPAGPTLPRLQLSTSGLGFSDSEFEISPDSPPRKVMLSESERKMINQQRELQLQRQASQKSRQTERPPRASGDGDIEKEPLLDIPYWGWKNVAAAHTAGPKLPDYGNRSRFNSIAAVTSGNMQEPEDHPFLDRAKFEKARTVFEKKAESSTRAENGPARTRSRTNPESMGLGTTARPARQRRVARSAERKSGSGMPRMSIDGPGPSMETRKPRGRPMRG
jgi:Arrestin (or S-antigen), C-terminal domain